VGWLAFFIGLVAPVPIGWWLIGKRRANALLSLLGLASLSVIVWAAALGAKVSSCKVGSCISSSQHNRLVIAIVALAILLVAYGLLAVGRTMLGGGTLAVALLVGAFGNTKTDTAAAIMLLVFAIGAAIYVLVQHVVARDEQRVPDFPPIG
jgi:ABC-type Na+ efflux pump permease subunit